MDFDADMIKSMAQNDFEIEYFRRWEIFKDDMEEYGAAYGRDFDESGYNIYKEEFVRLCKEQGIEFNEEDWNCDD